VEIKLTLRSAWGGAGVEQLHCEQNPSGGVQCPLGGVKRRETYHQDERAWRLGLQKQQPRGTQERGR